MATPAEDHQTPIGPGTEIKNIWKLTTLIGAGSFGQIYMAETIKNDPKTEVAIKFERLDAPRQVLHVETYALVQMQGFHSNTTQLLCIIHLFCKENHILQNHITLVI